VSLNSRSVIISVRGAPTNLDRYVQCLTFAQLFKTLKSDLELVLVHEIGGVVQDIDIQ